jgi:helicase MOV-10
MPDTGNTLNKRQRGFIDRVYSAERGVTLLHGPPGTGKTTAIVELLVRLLRATRCERSRGVGHGAPRILVCTPSNFSADLIVENVVKSLKKASAEATKADIVRIAAVRRAQEEMSESVLKFRCELQRAQLPDARIVVTTLSMAGKLFAALENPRGQFDLVVIDEAGQASEPDSCNALQFVVENETRVVLAGDHKQLRPVVLSGVAQEFGLGISMLERLAVQAPDAVVTLRSTYRAHLQIARLYMPVYGGLDVETKLTSRVIAPAVLPNGGHALLWHT